MSEATKVVGLVCAAGVGSRMGLGSPKQYMKFGSEAMLVHTVRALRAVERMGEIVVVVSPTDPYIDDVRVTFLKTSGCCAAAAGSVRSRSSTAFSTQGSTGTRGCSCMMRRDPA